MHVNEIDKHRSFQCSCLDKNIWVESLVVALTLISGLAITGENLLAFHLITVPQRIEATFNDSSDNATDHHVMNVVSENVRVNDILKKVFHYASLGIAGLFFVEIVFKVCSLHKKFIIDPWQIFDVVVVLATLTLELVFHFVLLNKRALHSLTYLVLLRLWRIPMLCNIRAYAVQEDSESDIEMYKSGKLKADEKCKMLENTLSQRAETIRKLEKLLQNFSGTTQTDQAPTKDQFQRNGHLSKKKDIDDKSGAYYDSSDLVKPENSAYSSLLKIPKNQSQSQKIPVDEMETQFMALSEADNPKAFTDLNKNASDHASYYMNTENCKEISEDHKERVFNNSYSAIKSLNINSVDKATTENNNLSHTEKSSIPSTSSYQSQIRLRGRKRRSSTSEVLDYTSLSFPNLEIEFVDGARKLSYHKLNSENNTLLTQDIKDKDFREISNINDKRASTISDSVTEVHSTTSDEIKSSFMKTRTRRFLSCPEYVFTQRMSLTSDESRLIEDGHATADYLLYNNLGFDCDNSFLQVMAEYNGTKTYRNEDGIPMTSL